MHITGTLHNDSSTPIESSHTQVDLSVRMNKDGASFNGFVSNLPSGFDIIAVGNGTNSYGIYIKAQGAWLKARLKLTANIVGSSSDIITNPTCVASISESVQTNYSDSWHKVVTDEIVPSDASASNKLVSANNKNCNSGISNLFFADTSYTISGITITKDAEDYLTSNSTSSDTRVWNYDNSNVFLTLDAGTYVFKYEAKSGGSGNLRACIFNDVNKSNIICDVDTSTLRNTFTLTQKTNIGIVTKLYSYEVRFTLCKAENEPSSYIFGARSNTDLSYRTTSSVTSGSTVPITSGGVYNEFKKHGRTSVIQSGTSFSFDLAENSGGIVIAHVSDGQKQIRAFSVGWNGILVSEDVLSGNNLFSLSYSNGTLTITGTGSTCIVTVISF